LDEETEVDRGAASQVAAGATRTAAAAGPVGPGEAKAVDRAVAEDATVVAGVAVVAVAKDVAVAAVVAVAKGVAAVAATDKA